MPKMEEAFASEYEGHDLCPEDFEISHAYLQNSVPVTVAWFLKNQYDVVKIRNGKGELVPCVEIGVETMIHNPFTNKPRTDFVIQMWLDLVAFDRGGNIIIIDHKTASKSYSDTKVRTAMQLPIYAYGMQRIFKEQGLKYTGLTQFEALMKTKKIELKAFPRIVTPDDINKALVDMNLTIEGMNSAAYYPAVDEMAHNYCGFKDACLNCKMLDKMKSAFELSTSARRPIIRPTDKTIITQTVEVEKPVIDPGQLSIPETTPEPVSFIHDTAPVQPVETKVETKPASFEDFMF
jgi:hypothetical protein